MLFLHANISHLFFNMLGLGMFGRDLIAYYGGRGFLKLYFAAVFAAGVTQLAVSNVLQSENPAIGASGGVFGVLLAYAMCFPTRQVMMLFPPIPLPAWLFAGLYAFLELVMGIAGARGDIAHFAHLGGMVGAYLMVRRLRT